MPIPLLRFPLLVLDEVIKAMQFRQLFNLSLCSKRLHRAVKSLRGKSIESKLDLSCGDTIYINLNAMQWINRIILFDVKQTPNDEPEGWRTDQLEGVLFQQHDYKLISYCENVQDGTRRLVEYISDLFSAPIKEVYICNSDGFWMVDWVEKRQGARTYEVCIHKYTTLTDDEFRHLLVGLNPTGLNINVTPSENFRIESFDKKYDLFRLRYGSWLTGEHLLTLDCIEMDLHMNTFTGTDINRFLRHVLLNGGAPRLTEFVSMCYGDANRVLDGIRGVLAEEQFEEEHSRWSFEGKFERGGQSMTVGIGRIGVQFFLNIR